MSIIKTQYSDKIQLINRMLLFGYAYGVDYDIIDDADNQ